MPPWVAKGKIGTLLLASEMPVPTALGTRERLLFLPKELPVRSNSKYHPGPDMTRGLRPGSKVGLTAAKAAALRTNLNNDGCGVVEKLVFIGTCSVTTAPVIVAPPG